MDSLLNEHSVELLLALVSAVVGMVYRWKVSKEARRSVAVQALEVGIHHAWEDLGRALKEKAKDGKYSAEERSDLYDKAVMHARAIAKKEGVSIISELGRYYIPVLVREIINKRKGESRSMTLLESTTTYETDTGSDGAE